MKRPTVVIDSSVACAWHIPHEKHDFIDGILDALESGSIVGIAPKLWVFEVHNVIPKRMKKFNHEDALIDEALDTLLDVSIELKGHLPPVQNDSNLALLAKWVELDTEAVKAFTSRVRGLVRKYPKIAFYDAVYLDLAKEFSGELACLDGNLAEAARKENVPLRVPEHVFVEWCDNKNAFEKAFKSSQTSP